VERSCTPEADAVWKLVFGPGRPRFLHHGHSG
jgi:hypothetical protein